MDPRYIIILNWCMLRSSQSPPEYAVQPSIGTGCLLCSWYYHTCVKAMAEDGVLGATNFTIEECAMMLANTVQ